MCVRVCVLDTVLSPPAVLCSASKSSTRRVCAGESAKITEGRPIKTIDKVHSAKQISTETSLHVVQAYSLVCVAIKIGMAAWKSPSEAPPPPPPLSPPPPPLPEPGGGNTCGGIKTFSTYSIIVKRVRCVEAFCLRHQRVEGCRPASASVNMTTLTSKVS